MVREQCQTAIVPEIPPDYGEDKQQHLYMTGGTSINLNEKPLNPSPNPL